MVVKKGLVSTIIPVFNRPKEIEEAVASVVAQKYRPIEIIIVNDRSTDETGSTTERLRDRYGGIVHILEGLGQGPGPAREKGRLAAKGEFIQYLDSDDILMPGKFASQVQGLRTHPECGVAYGKTRCYHRETGPSDVAWKRTGERIDTMFPAFVQSRWWGTSTPLYRRGVIDKAGPWLSLWNEEDWEYDCRIARQGVRLHFCDEFVSDQRWSDEPRLSNDGTRDPRKLTDRAKAHQFIYGHAKAYGIEQPAPEMQYFAREVFLLCRQCGAAGLEQEAKILFELAREATLPERRNRLDFRGYKALAELIGWSRAGKLSCQSDKIRSVDR